MPTATPPIPIPVGKIAFVGAGLVRPECVLATRSGMLHTADWRGGVASTPMSGGASTLLAGGVGDLRPMRPMRPMRPNGIALRRDGSFLLADLGESRGGVFALSRTGQIRPLIESVDGIDLPPTNFVFEDARGRIWITVSTRQMPRALGYRPDVADGFIVLIDERGARIVADGLGYTNEAMLSPDGEWLHVNETFGRRLTRLRVRPDGSLGERQTITAFGHGTYPDGLAFDCEGAVWITSIVSNRVIHVDRDGSQTIVLEDADPAHVQWCEDAYLAGSLDREHLDRASGQVLRNISSLAFGGSDLRTAFLGCLLGDSIAFFRTSVAGRAPFHWDC